MPVTYQGTREIPLDELTPFPGNARRGVIPAIAESLAINGQYRSVVVRDTGGALVILAGNHTFQSVRLLAAMTVTELQTRYGGRILSAILQAEQDADPEQVALHRAALDSLSSWSGRHTIRCEVIECDDAEARRINLADNRLAELGGYDEAALLAILGELDGDFTATGWDQDAYDDLLPRPRLTDPDDIPPTPVEAVTQPGDLWQLGPHRLLCADAADPAQLDRLLDGVAIDYTFTSPPYGIDLEYEEGEPLDALISLVERVIAQIDRISKPHAYATMNYADVFRPGDKGFTIMSPFYNGPFQACGWHLRGNRVWFKPFGRLSLSYATSTTMNLREWEYVQTWRRGSGREKLRAHGITARGVWQTFGDGAIIADWRDTDVTTDKATHPAAFPVVLPVVGLRAYTDTGARVFDPFAGSGSTLIACHIERRVALLTEIDPRYCDVICARYQAHTGTKPELVEAGGV